MDITNDAEEKFPVVFLSRIPLLFSMLWILTLLSFFGALPLLFLLFPSENPNVDTRALFYLELTSEKAKVISVVSLVTLVACGYAFLRVQRRLPGNLVFLPAEIVFHSDRVQFSIIHDSIKMIFLSVRKNILRDTTNGYGLSIKKRNGDIHRFRFHQNAEAIIGKTVELEDKNILTRIDADELTTFDEES